MLPAPTPRARGAVDSDRALAAAKLAEAETLGEATTWLSPKERLAILHDPALLDRLVRLA